MNHLKHVFSFVSVATLVSALGGCAAAGSESEESVAQASEALGTEVCPAGVPATLTPPAGETLKLALTGVGVQIYMCNANAAGFAWTFVAPQANLYNDDGKLVGTHFIGPTWQGNDGSSVAGKKLFGATVDATALPWLLLQATTHAAESGRFDDVTSIQRLSTVGGNAPANGCDAAHLGTILQVPYSAEYVFYRAKVQGAVKQCSG
jgi:hypothetical protein